jgi:ribosomal protein L11 methyltransferase
VTWWALRVEPGERRQAIIAVLFASGAYGLQEESEALVTHFSTEHAARSAAATIAELAPDAAYTVASVPDVDWTAAWRAGLRSFNVGALTIAPPWIPIDRDPARTVVIDPGMAFGTGDHASTRGAARLLQRALRRGDSVADLGTGSAVLAIAAAKLGARRVVGIEIDDTALGNAQENVARNRVDNVVHLVEGDAFVILPLVAPVDVVTANILAPVIIDLLPVIRASLAPGGRAIVAGILESESEPVRAALAAQALRVTDQDREDGWWSALIDTA